MLNESKGKTYVLLESVRFHSSSTSNIHYLRSWRRESYAQGAYRFDGFALTHSSAAGLYYEEFYGDLKSLAKRKSEVLNRWNVKMKA